MCSTTAGVRSNLNKLTSAPVSVLGQLVYVRDELTCWSTLKGRLRRYLVFVSFKYEKCLCLQVDT